MRKIETYKTHDIYEYNIISTRNRFYGVLLDANWFFALEEVRGYIDHNEAIVNKKFSAKDVVIAIIRKLRN